MCMFGYSMNNRNASVMPPSNMNINDIPMMITIIFDDALNAMANELTNKISNHYNKNGERIPLVFFVSNKYSDYSIVQQKYLQGCEIAINTVTRTTGVPSNLTKWFYEITKSREFISLHGNIPIDSMNGFRAPILAKADNMFKVLKHTGFKYDSSINERYNSDGLFNWPYTFDRYDEDKIFNVGQGPQESYPGLWEIPLYYLYKNDSKSHFTLMDLYNGDYQTILDTFMHNFLERKNSNKVPLILNLNALWLNDPEKVNALNDFITTILRYNDTFIVTNQQLIDWINNPISMTQMRLMGYPNFRNRNSIKNNNLIAFNECKYQGGFVLRTVLNECPHEYPTIHYYPNDYVHAILNFDIIDNNTITTDICSDSNYTEYDHNEIYCEDIINNGYDLVIYNDSIWQCKWWITGSLPSDGWTGWEFIESCYQTTKLFHQGIINPYGMSEVFWRNSFNIDIIPFDGYIIDYITVNNSIIFPWKNYDLNIINDTSIHIQIRFCEITAPVYNIGVVFTENSTKSRIYYSNVNRIPKKCPIWPELIYNRETDLYNDSGMISLSLYHIIIVSIPYIMTMY